MSRHLLIVAALLATTACSMVASVSCDRAIELALAGAPDNALVASAESGPLAQFTDDAGPSLTRDRQVWAVVLSGRFPSECVDTPGRATCVTDAESQLIVLDASTGDVLYVVTPADMNP